jgi:iron-sulfur cluster repair protein YtfE (RIC family)
MTVDQASSEDISVVLIAQHQQIRAMFREVQTCPPAERQQAFEDLRAFLAVHEAAEEVILRPATRKHGADEVADERNLEEKHAAELLAELDDRQVDDLGFMEALERLKSEVEAHARKEEELELPRLISQTDAEERESLGRRLLQAERLAPTHPHPATTGSSTATALAGPFAAMLDRAKDALEGQDPPQVG